MSGGFFKFLASNKCDAQTTAKAFYRAPAVWSSVETFVTQGTLHNYFEFCIFLLASVQAGLTDAWATGNQLLFLSHPLNHIAKNPQLGKKKKNKQKMLNSRTIQSLNRELNRIIPISGKWEARKAEYFQGTLMLILGVRTSSWCFSFISALCHSGPCQHQIRAMLWDVHLSQQEREKIHISEPKPQPYPHWGKPDLVTQHMLAGWMKYSKATCH